VRDGFKMVQSRGQTLFKNPGVFIEAFFPQSRHVEVQVFGNGLGQAVHFGEVSGGLIVRESVRGVEC
jgi:urea carboxylase